MSQNAVPHDDRVPVTIVTGFLGSGKTTVLNHLVRQPEFQNAAVGINEFGEIDLDGSFVDHPVKATTVMAGGCVCCVLQEDFEGELLRLFTQSKGHGQPLSSLILETSGLADPAPLIQFLIGNPIANRAFRLAAVICTIDAVLGPDQLRRNAEAIRQVALADRLLLTKLDLVPDGTERLRQALRELNAEATIVEALHGQIRGPIRIEAQSEHWADPASLARWLKSASSVAPPARHTAGIHTFSLTATAPLRQKQFSTWLTSVRVKHSERILRVKGIVTFANELHPFAVHGVQHVFHPLIMLTHLPPGDRSSRIVFITQGSLHEDVESGWMAVQQNLVPST